MTEAKEGSPLLLCGAGGRFRLLAGPGCNAVPSLALGVIPGTHSSHTGCRDPQGEQGAATALAKAQPLGKGPGGSWLWVLPQASARCRGKAQGRQFLASHTEPEAQDVCDTLNQSRQRKIMMTGNCGKLRSSVPFIKPNELSSTFE